MKKSEIRTAKGPQAIGPYSQAIVAGDLVFVSGQIPLDPESGEMIDGGIEAQTDRVMRNLGGILEASGSSLGDVVRTTVYLADMGEFSAMNAVYGRHFEGTIAPSRATVQVAALPKGARVEIDAIALKS